MKVSISVIARYARGRQVLMVKASDTQKPHRVGVAPLLDEDDDEQYEAAVAAAVQQLMDKRTALHGRRKKRRQEVGAVSNDS
jgi:hypothetical protein